jgi:hypothetical protein
MFMLIYQKYWLNWDEHDHTFDIEYLQKKLCYVGQAIVEAWRL